MWHRVHMVQMISDVSLWKDRDVRTRSKANQQLEEARSRHSGMTNPLYVREEEIRVAMLEADRALRELDNTCVDEELLSERNKVSEHLNTMRSRRSECESKSRELRIGAKPDREETKYVSTSKAEDLNARADRRDAQAKELEKELPSLRKQISKTEAQEKEIRERMLAP